MHRYRLDYLSYGHYGYSETIQLHILIYTLYGGCLVIRDAAWADSFCAAHWPWPYDLLACLPLPSRKKSDAAMAIC